MPFSPGSIYPLYRFREKSGLAPRNAEGVGRYAAIDGQSSAFCFDNISIRAFQEFLRTWSTNPLVVPSLLLAAARILCASFREHHRSTVVLGPESRLERNGGSLPKRPSTMSSWSMVLSKACN